MKQDRNFDSLIDKFEKRVYDTVKGEWRLTLLKEDLAFLHQKTNNSSQKPPGLVVFEPKNGIFHPLSIWDAGCGFGQMAQWFAEAGHQLTLCDLSGKMINQAKQNFTEAELDATFYHAAAQDLVEDLPQFDLVLSHAVVEWLANPAETLQQLLPKVKPGGFLSLLFYNRNAMVYTNVLKGKWRWKEILNDNYLGKGKHLTPPNPQYPEDMLTLLEENGFTPLSQTGIRVFHDYLTPEVLEESDTQELLDLEYRYCRHPTYRHMGRYIHVVAQRTTNEKADPK